MGKVSGAKRAWEKGKNDSSAAWKGEQSLILATGVASTPGVLHRTDDEAGHNHQYNDSYPYPFLGKLQWWVVQSP